MDSLSTILGEGDPPSKQAILCAALELFVRRGYDATTIRDIASQAKYTNPAIFKFFKSKEDLGTYIFERAYRELLDRFEHRFQKDGTLDNVIAQWVETYFALLGDNLYALLFVHDHLTQFWPRVADRFGGESLFRLMRAWVERGRAAGIVSATVPVEIQMAAVSGFFHQCARMVYLGELDPTYRVPVRDGAREVLLRILKPTRDRPKSRRKR